MCKSSSVDYIRNPFQCSFFMRTFLLVFAIQSAAFFKSCLGDVEVISEAKDPHWKSAEYSRTTEPPSVVNKYVTNLTVSAQRFKHFKENLELQLKISWQNENDEMPKGGYEIDIVQEKNFGCSNDIIDIHDVYETTKEYPLSPAHSFKIKRHCVYTIVVAPSPNPYKQSSSISYTVPACMYGICSCYGVKLDPPAEVSAKQIDTSVIEISWKYASLARLQNISFIYFDIKTLQENTAWIKLGSSDLNSYSTSSDNSVLVKLKEEVHVGNYALHPNVKYVVRACYENAHSCKGKSSTASFVVTTAPKDDKAEEDNQTDVFSQILLPVFITLGILALLLYVFQKWCPNKFMKVSSPARSIQPTNDSFRYDVIATKLIENDLYVQTDRYEISRTQLKLGKLIGIGAFGEVYIAQLQSEANGKFASTVAVKTLKDGASTEEINEFKTEIAMLKMIGKHDNVVTILGCCTEKQPYLMVMEYVPCGDLRHYLQALRKEFELQNINNAKVLKPPLSPRTPDTSSDCSYITPDGPLPNNSRTSMTETEYTLLVSEPSTPGLHAPTLEKVLDPKELQSFAVQIAKGMKYLQEKQIVHRDLAARNVLIDEYKTLKISDFGMSRTGVYTNTKRRKLPLRWMAIESIKENLYTSKSDVWSYGIVLWEIGTLGGFPYPTVANHELLNYLLTGNRLECPDNCTEDLYKVMLCCWKYSPESRPSFGELMDLLDDVGRRKKTYVDFSCLNPSYVFPPTEEQPRQSQFTARLNFNTVEIVLPNPNASTIVQQEPPQQQ